MSPTPDERRASWVEPGLAKRVEEDGKVTLVAINLERATTYDGNGISVHTSPDGEVHVLLSAAAVRRIYGILGEDGGRIDGLSRAEVREAVDFARRHGWNR
jgi:hypothetical protein